MLGISVALKTILNLHEETNVEVLEARQNL